MLLDKINGVLTSHTHPTDIANLLQKQFCSVFSNPSDTNIEAASFEPPIIDHPFTDEMLEFSIADVVAAIDEIKPSAAAGPDGIPVCLLKSCKESLAVPIHMIWSRSMNEGNVPSIYKSSFVSPLHKKDSKAMASNYRPISLTSHIVKIYERVLRNRMVSHLEKNGLICNRQHGFRRGKSCLTQLLHHFDEIIEAFQNGHDVDAIYLDYAKAFDKVDHRLLLAKLRIYGFSDKLIKWVESFLTDRTQQVVVSGHLSLIAIILSGVPQGTVLGPILFLIFINDIHSCVQHSIVRCFADDTRLCKSITSCSDISKLQTDLENVIAWSRRNNMQLHQDKFELMCHSSNRKLISNLLELPFTSELFQYDTDTGTISPVDHLRDLGVTVTSELSWSTHIGMICNTARKMAAWVCSVFYIREQEIMLTLYKSLVRCHLEYCSPLWNPSKISEIQELESVQRSFTRRISGLSELGYWDRLKALSLMSLQRRRERYVIIHMWKIRRGLTSNDLDVQFVNNDRLGPRATIPPLCRGSSTAHQSLRDNSFRVMGPKLWNCLPKRIRLLETIEAFKTQLTNFLLSIPDKPPIRGFTSPNSNSILDWRVDRDASALFGSQAL